MPEPFGTWCALSLAAALCVIGACAAHASGGIALLGTTQDIWDIREYGFPFGDIAAFQGPDGRAYLLTAGIPQDGVVDVIVIDASEPPDPTGAGRISVEIDASERLSISIFETPGKGAFAAITGKGTRIIDLSDPSKPTLASPPEGSGGSAVLDAAGWVEPFLSPDDRAYALVHSVDGHLAIVDMTDPYNPLPMPPSVPSNWMRSAVFQLSGGHAYALAFDWNGAAVINLTDPRNPALVSALVQSAHHRTSERYAHLPDSAIVDVEGIYFGRFIDTWDVSTYRTLRGHAYAMIATDSAGPADRSEAQFASGSVWFLNVTDPGAPLPVGAVDDLESDIRRPANVGTFQSADNRTYGIISHGNDPILIVDVTDPDAPSVSGTIRDGEGGFDAASGIGGIAVFESGDGRTHMAVAGYEGIQIADMTDPREPFPAGAVLTGGDMMHGLVVLEAAGDRQYAFAVRNGGLHILNVTEPRLPTTIADIQKGVHGGMPYGIRAVTAFISSDGGARALAVGYGGMLIIDVAEPDAPRIRGGMPAGQDLKFSHISGVAALGHPDGRDYALIADHDYGVYIIDATNPDAPRLAGVVGAGPDALGGVHGIVAFKTPGGVQHALVARDAGIQLLDMTVPTSPILAGTAGSTLGDYTLTLIHHVAVLESEGRIHALLADYASGVHLIDITNPSAPAYGGSIPAERGGSFLVPGFAVAAVDSPDGQGYALLVRGDIMEIADIAGSSAPLIVDRLPTGSGGLGLNQPPWEMAVWKSKGGTYALANNGYGMWTIDVTYPHTPVPVGGVDGLEARIGVSFEAHAGETGILAGGDGYIHAINVANPRVPALTDSMPFAGMLDLTVTESPDGNAYALITGPAGSVRVAGIADPHEGATSQSDLDVPPGFNMDVFRPHDGRTYALMAGADSAYVLDITYPRSPALAGMMRDNLGGFYRLGDISDVSAFESGGRAYVLVGGGEGIQVVDVTNPFAPAPVAGLGAYGDGRPLAVSGISTVSASDGTARALVVDRAGKIVALDLSRPDEPVLASAISEGAAYGPAPEATLFEAAGGSVYALVAAGDVSIIDVTDSHGAFPVAVLEGLGAHYSIVFKSPENRAFAFVLGSGGAHVIYVDEPDRFYRGLLVK